ncbi:MAG TPA: penicillin-binding protein 2 [Deltaproteobacteria bacterium]|nr:penicillin-binding protein 2 [Deltaproteobacteria bacterium]
MGCVDPNGHRHPRVSAEPLLGDVTEQELIDRFVDGARSDRWHDVVLARDLPADQLDRVLAQRAWLPGIAAVSRHRRSYPEGGLFSHLVGYLREVRADELEGLKERYRDREQGEDWYRSGDLIGKYGIESAHEEWLRGVDGAYWVQVDVHGRELGRSTAGASQAEEYYQSIAHFLDQAVVPEQPGHDLHLTIRRDIQELAVELLGEQSGAVVVMEVQTGRVLALVSAPGFDPEIFSRRITPEAWKVLSQDPRHPLVDKALQGVYPPGSTWKMIVAAAALGTDTWTKETTVRCKGSHKVGRRRFHCWNRKGHGRVDLKKALAGSCDVYFYKAGLALGIDTVARYASMFGMGDRTGIAINSESEGLNPDTGWKRRRFRSRPQSAAWKLGDTASAVIGQGYTLATPMQLTIMTAAIANGGTVYRPLLLDRVVGQNGDVVHRADPEVVGHVDLAQEHFQSIREGMLSVVDDLGGTARKQRVRHLAYAGKTGTAQVVSLKTTRRRYRGKKVPRHLLDHAWFVGYAPYEDPELAVTVLVEHGEHGSQASAPIVRKIFEHYFANRIQQAKEGHFRVGDSRPLPPLRRKKKPIVRAPPTPEKPAPAVGSPAPTVTSVGGVEQVGSAMRPTPPGEPSAGIRQAPIESADARASVTTGPLGSPSSVAPTASVISDEEVGL